MLLLNIYYSEVIAHCGFHKDNCASIQETTVQEDVEDALDNDEDECYTMAITCIIDIFVLDF